jgi:YggT family protein
MVYPLLLFIRYAAIGVFALAVLAAVGSWLVRTRRVSPFRPLGRALRETTDPLLKPVEARVLRAGGNPVNAGWWLVIGVALIGVIVVSLSQWLVGGWLSLSRALYRGPRATLIFAIGVMYYVLILALFARVISSWFGVFRYSRWIRPAYVLTDWIVVPIRRLLPSTGMFDFSPLVAWFVLYLLQLFVIRVLLAL